MQTRRVTRTGGWLAGGNAENEQRSHGIPGEPQKHSDGSGGTQTSAKREATALMSDVKESKFATVIRHAVTTASSSEFSASRMAASEMGRRDFGHSAWRWGITNVKYCRLCTLKPADLAFFYEVFETTASP